MFTILLIKTTAAQNEGALSYHRVRGAVSSGSCFYGRYSNKPLNKLGRYMYATDIFTR